MKDCNLAANHVILKIPNGSSGQQGGSALTMRVGAHAQGQLWQDSPAD